MYLYKNAREGDHVVVFGIDGLIVNFVARLASLTRRVQVLL